MNRSPSIHPIGIFDSGIGGLTVAHAVTQQLPSENIIYFGDTAHLPYGDKSTAAIQAYSVKICDMFLKQSCKLILMACHSASAAAYELVKEYAGNTAHVINVIDPVVHHLREHYAGKRIGLIGTRQTINSNIYKKKIDELGNGTELCSLATPLLATLIEEGFSKKKIIADVISDYLQAPELQNIDALILGCTHYPLVKEQIADYYHGKVGIIDPSEIVATAVQGWLHYHNLLNKNPQPTQKFYVSDYTESFEASTRLFFTENVHLEHYPLWVLGSVKK
jgi:glutamate racemase